MKIGDYVRTKHYGISKITDIYNDGIDQVIHKRTKDIELWWEVNVNTCNLHTGYRVLSSLWQLGQKTMHFLRTFTKPYV